MSELDDSDIVRRLSALTEDYVLAYFWMMFRKNVDPLELLTQMTRVTIARPAAWNPADIRREHERGARTLDPNRRCFACSNTQCRLYSHHIIEVYHGGSNNPRNQVPLCFVCHQKLHPWLIEEPPPSHVHGFESVGEIAKRALEHLQ